MADAKDPLDQWFPKTKPGNLPAVPPPAVSLPQAAPEMPVFRPEPAAPALRPLPETPVFRPETVPPAFKKQTDPARQTQPSGGFFKTNPPAPAVPADSAVPEIPALKKPTDPARQTQPPRQTQPSGRFFQTNPPEPVAPSRQTAPARQTQPAIQAQPSRQTQPPRQTQPTVRYATLNSRFAAALIDYLILLPVTFLLRNHSVIQQLLIGAYFVFFDCSAKCGTPGKLVMKIQVLNASAQRLPFKIALLRYIIYSLTPAAATILSTILIKTGNVILVLPGMAILLASIAVMFMPGYTKYKQGLHDKLLKTYVIYRF